MNERFKDVVIVTAADRGYFDLLCGMIRSVRRFEEARSIPIAVFDVGLEEAHLEWLRRHDVAVVEPQWHFGMSERTAKSYERAALVRFFIHDYLPGYRFSMWLDPDLWLQDSEVLDRMMTGAAETGAAVAHESDPLYAFQAWLWAWNLKHKIVGSGLRNGVTLLTHPSLNLGLYCIAADAPHWKPWRARFERSLKRTNRITPYEQFAFNEVVHVDRVPTRILDATDNWICDRSPPVWDEERRLFCRPATPFKPLSILHLAGPAKHRRYDIRLVDGQTRQMSLRFASQDQETARKVEPSPMRPVDPRSSSIAGAPG